MRVKVGYVIPLVILLSSQEIALRIVFPMPEVLNFNRIDYSAVQITPEMQDLAHLSNASFSWTSDPDGARFVHTLNLYGFRDTDWNVDKEESAQRIMFVGDSFVEGFMASQGNTIPDHFERLAQGEGIRIEALNMGVGANGILGYLDLIHDAVPIFRPDQVVLILYANDLPSPAIGDSLAREPLEPVFSSPWQPRIFYIANRIRQKETVPRQWVTRPFPFLAAVPSDSNPWSSDEWARQRETFVEPSIVSAMKSGRFNPFIVDEYVARERGLRTESNNRPMVEHLNEYLSRWDTQLSIAYLPHRDQTSDAYLNYEQHYSSNKNPTSLMGQEYQRHPQDLMAVCAALDVPFLDLTPAVRTAEAEGERLYWNYDGHMNETGYALVGETLFNWWESLLQR